MSMRSRPAQHRQSRSEDESASFCGTFPASTRADARFWPAWRQRGFVCVPQEFTAPTSFQKSVNPLPNALMLSTCLMDPDRAATGLITTSRVIAAATPTRAGLPIHGKVSAFASAGDVSTGSWANRMTHFRWRRTCSIQGRLRIRKCGWYGLWAHWLACAWSCLSSKKRQTPERDPGGGSEMGRVTVVLFALASAAFAGSIPADGEALFRECEFKAASRSFERALIKEPGNARLHFWLGKSYARMAEVASLLSAQIG